jgi:HD-GYP domain-containing protein (c-di-GMP phosphodiesterase class II)
MKPNLRIKYPIHTLDNQILLPAGSEMSPGNIDDLISTNRNTYSSISLLSYKSVQKDITKFIKSTPSYSVIIGDDKQIAGLMKHLGSVTLISPLLDMLDYFKEYDFYTYRHHLMVWVLSTHIATVMIGDYIDCMKVAESWPTHDVGKICVPLGVLQKQTPLNEEEHNCLERHTMAGYVLLSYYHKDKNTLASIVARDHHERIDGSGYLREINLDNRLVEIVIISDIYDALISPRPYRHDSFDNRTACEEITRMAEKNKLHWEIVQCLVALNRKGRPHFTECNIPSEKRGTPPSSNNYGITTKRDVK